MFMESGFSFITFHGIRLAEFIQTPINAEFTNSPGAVHSPSCKSREMHVTFSL